MSSWPLDVECKFLSLFKLQEWGDKHNPNSVRILPSCWQNLLHETNNSLTWWHSAGSLMFIQAHFLVLAFRISVTLQTTSNNCFMFTYLQRLKKILFLIKNDDKQPWKFHSALSWFACFQVFTKQTKQNYEWKRNPISRRHFLFAVNTTSENVMLRQPLLSFSEKYGSNLYPFVSEKSVPSGWTLF